MIIAIEKATPGMQLLEDVHLPSGAVLVNSDQVLTASLIGAVAGNSSPKNPVIAPPEAQSAAENPLPSDDKNPRPPLAPLHPLKDSAGRPAGPRLKVIISKDAMSAKLCMEPSEEADEQLHDDAIVDVLHAAGVIFGIDEKAGERRHGEMEQIQTLL